MTTPRATYRLQLREGMTFDKAAALVPYLAELGVSHLYAAPIFTAAPGSTHGYDVADHGALDPVLGGADGFARLASALREHGLGLILDIVPNHMAASPANPWWRDVLTWGERSRYASHFDIDWTAPKLLIPVLGEPLGEALAEGKLELRLDAEARGLAVGYYDLALPVTPASYPLVFRDGALGERAARAAAAGPEQAGEIAREIACDGAAPAAVAAVSGDAARLAALVAAQVWRLAYWRLAREALTYRRFFEISDLVGVRVEDAAVFADVHDLPLRLVREGVVDGLRIDHIDGLADPKKYLEDLRAASALDYVVVEKILGDGEDLREDWACAGTTGYEVARWITALQVDRRGEAAMTQAWTAATGADSDFHAQVLATKRQLATVNFAGELARLTDLAHAVAQEDPLSRDFGRDALRLALVEMLAALPVYRSYLDEREPAAADRALVEGAVAAALAARQAEDRRVLDFVAGLMLGAGAGSGDRRLEFARRFQQLSGPLTAKAVEDTVFYRYNRLIALNEVGAEPAEFGVGAAAFHEAMAARAGRWPAALSATATHDTKRGEDARARLAVLSEMPAAWADATARWREMLGPAVPGRGEAWLFFQALAGAWPPQLEPGDADGTAELAQRLADFMVKALREAKERTSWTAPDADYEAAVTGFVRAVFAADRRPLLDDIAATVGAIAAAGLVNALAQTALKLTVPGVPDIYQGCELMDFSMVDPDNRRPVDFELRRDLLARVGAMEPDAAMADWRGGLPKLWLTARLLDLRRRRPRLFAEGGYRPLEVAGEGARHIVAFARERGDEAVAVIVPRLVLGRLADRSRPAFDAAAFADASVALPGGGRCLGGNALGGSPRLDRFPVSVVEYGP